MNKRKILTLTFVGLVLALVILSIVRTNKTVKSLKAQEETLLALKKKIEEGAKERPPIPVPRTPPPGPAAPGNNSFTPESSQPQQS